VAQDGRGFSGHVLLRDDEDGDGSTVELGRLFVRPTVRRQGVAAGLMSACRDWAAASGLGLVLHVVSGTPAATLIRYRLAGQDPTPR
jgi:GNAT superfamily N-acetyltransferase